MTTAQDKVSKALRALDEIKDLNCVVRMLEESAMATATALDDAGGPDTTSPLQGMPIVVKANVAVANAVLDGACPALADNVAATDATLVARLRKAGAVPVAQTNLHELAFGVSSKNTHFGAVKNPKDPTRMAGGSSGGTAVAVAAGAVPGGVGTDTGGSGRLPAAMCGCVGMRPTTGRYPGDGILKLTDTLDTISLMARDIATLAVLDAAVTGEDAQPNTDAPRIGVVRDPFWTGISKDATDCGQAVLDRLATSGATLIEHNAPEIETLTEASGFPIALSETKANWDVMAPELTGLTLSEFANKIASPDVQSLFQAMAAGELPPPEAYEAAMKQSRPALRKLMAEIFDTLDVEAVIFPTLATSAPPLDQDGEAEIDGVLQPFFPTFTRRALIASVSALPAISIPCGTDAAGLPFGMEIVGRSGADRPLISLARFIEKAVTT